MIRKGAIYFYKGDIMRVLENIAVAKDINIKILELISQKLNEIEGEKVSDELMFLENTIREQRAQITLAEEEKKKLINEMEFYKSIIRYFVERGNY